MAARASSAWVKTLKLASLILAGLLLLYAAAGFWIAPYLIKEKLPRFLEQELGRSASIQELSINPFLLTVDLKGFAVQRKKGDGRFVGVDELFIDFELDSVLKRAAVFDQIRLIGLFVAVGRFKDGAFNFDDLAVSPDEKEAQQDSSLFPVSITKLEIREGEVLFEDRSRKSAFRSQISPINLSLSDFHTHLDRASRYQFTAKLDSGGLLDCQGDIKIFPLVFNGRIKLSEFRTPVLWQTIQDMVNFEITDGAFNLDAQYRVHQKDKALQVEVSQGKYLLENLKITRKGKQEPLIDIPRLTLDGIALDLLGQKLSIASFSSEKASIHAWVRPDKEMNFVDLFTLSTGSRAGTAPSPSTASSGNSKWLVSVDKIALNDYGFLFEDRSLASPVTLNFNPIEVTLENFSSDLAAILPFSIKAAVNKTGHLDVAGGLGLSPVSTAVKLNLKLNLTDFQPYIDPVTELEFVGGDGIVKGDVDFKLDKDFKPQLKFKGMASIDNFVGQDKLQNEKLLEWKALRFEEFDFNLDPMKVLIKEVIAEKAYTRFIFNADRTTNISKVFGGGQSTVTKHGKPTHAKEQGDNTSRPALVQIDTVTIKNASANFADYSLKPKFATEMEGLNGRIRGFSTDRKSLASIDLKGKADRTAPVRIKGKIQFFDPQSYTDINLNFKNLNLSNLTPYSGKFAGYKIEKGKMSVDLNYKIEQKKLVAKNTVVIKKLTLGEEVESPDAVSLPLSLAIALLQDADGVINLDLPIRGSVDDPEFDIWGTIGGALVNLITKAVTAPFTALARLINSDEELDQVAFGPGRSDIPEQEKEKLAKVVESLAQRPTLNIEVKGLASDADAEQQFRNSILTAKKSALAKQNSAEEKKPNRPQSQPALTDEEFRRHLLQTYYMQVAGMKNLSLNAPMIDQNLNSDDVLHSARRKIYGRMLSEDDRFSDLAKTRAENIREYLIAQGLNEERIYLLDVNLEMNEESEADSNEWVSSKLSLTAN